KSIPTVFALPLRRSGFFVPEPRCTRVWSPSKDLWIKPRLWKQRNDSLRKSKLRQNSMSVSDGLFESRINRSWALKWRQRASMRRIQYAYKKTVSVAAGTWAAVCLYLFGDKNVGKNLRKESCSR